MAAGAGKQGALMSSKSRRTTPTRYQIAARINAIGRSKAREIGAARFVEHYEFAMLWDDNNFSLPEIGDPGIQCMRRRGWVGAQFDLTATVDCLIYRDTAGLLVGYLLRFPKAIRDKNGLVGSAGEITLAVKPDHRRQGIGTALLKEAASRWDTNWANQSYSASGLELIKSVVDREIITAEFDVCTVIVADSGEPVLEFIDAVGKNRR
jgi:GNAT superfamily N-acetyltransferase